MTAGFQKRKENLKKGQNQLILERLQDKFKDLKKDNSNVLGIGNDMKCKYFF